MRSIDGAFGCMYENFINANKFAAVQILYLGNICMPGDVLLPFFLISLLGFEAAVS